MWPRRIFLVDDDPFILTALRRLLRGKGYEISFFDTAEEVLDACAVDPPDVIVSDFYMPRTDGLDLFEQVAERHPDVGRIILTGGVFDERLKGALLASVVQVVLPKPWKLEVMQAGFEALRKGQIPTRIEWRGGDKPPRAHPATG